MRFCGVVLAFLACLSLPEFVESYTRRTAHKGLQIGEPLSLTLNSETLFRKGEWTDAMEKTMTAMYLEYTCVGCLSFVTVASMQKTDGWKLRVEDEHSKFSVSHIDEHWMLVTKVNMDIFHSGAFKVRLEFTEKYEAMEFLTLVMVEAPKVTKKSEYEGPALYAIQFVITIQIIALFLQSYRCLRLLFKRQDDKEREFVERVENERMFF